MVTPAEIAITETGPWGIALLVVGIVSGVFVGRLLSRLISRRRGATDDSMVGPKASSGERRSTARAKRSAPKREQRRGGRKRQAKRRS
jgi:hypothetical protein